MGKLYVAYGSNLNLKQMAYRCPSASIYGTGQLTNWELLYRGSATNSHATIAKKHGSLSFVQLQRDSPTPVVSSLSVPEGILSFPLNTKCHLLRLGAA